MTLDVTNWLPNLLGPLFFKVSGLASSAPRRSTINVEGMSVTDDPDNNQTTITPTAATTMAAGSMSADDKAKLDGMQKQGASYAVPAFDIDWSLAGVYTKALGTGGSTFTFSNAADGSVIVVILTGSGGSTVTWPAVKWAGGTPPTQTVGGTDVYTFVKAGSDVFGSVVQDMS
jgi:hypothetical protein